MRSTHAQRVLAVTAILTLLAAWAVVILVAMHVSEIVLDTLDMIVELAAISP